jgi:hypothetical protein
MVFVPAVRSPVRVRPVLGDDELELGEAADWDAIAAGGELEQPPFILLDNTQASNRICRLIKSYFLLTRAIEWTASQNQATHGVCRVKPPSYSVELSSSLKSNSLEGREGSNI